MLESEGEKLVKIEEVLSKRVIGQLEGIRAVSGFSVLQDKPRLCFKPEVRARIFPGFDLLLPHDHHEAFRRRPDEIEIKAGLPQLAEVIPGLFQGGFLAPSQGRGAGFLPAGFCGRDRPGIDADDQGTVLRIRRRWGRGRRRSRDEDQRGEQYRDKNEGCMPTKKKRNNHDLPPFLKGSVCPADDKEGAPPQQSLFSTADGEMAPFAMTQGGFQEGFPALSPSPAGKGGLSGIGQGRRRYLGMGVVVKRYLRSSSSKRMEKPP